MQTEFAKINHFNYTFNALKRFYLDKTNGCSDKGLKIC